MWLIKSWEGLGLSIFQEGRLGIGVQPYHIKWAKVRPNAIIPSKRPGDAGFDVYACIDEDIWIEPGETVLVSTGIAYEITPGWHLIAKERGSTGKIGLKTSAGVVDGSFRGEIFACLYNANEEKTIILSVNEEQTKAKLRADGFTVDDYDEFFIIYPITKAIQQLIPVYSPDGTWEEVDYENLSKTERGDGKLGSTGK
jgi:dUTP pyrophosphatase